MWVQQFNTKSLEEMTKEPNPPIFETICINSGEGLISSRILAPFRIPNAKCMRPTTSLLIVVFESKLAAFNARRRSVFDVGVSAASHALYFSYYWK